MRTVAPPGPHPTRVVLVRHGEARCNVEGRVGGHRGCTGLTAAGVAQAEALRARLVHSGELTDAAVVLYASVLTRAIETAAILAPAVGDGAVAVTECDLCELHPGVADGLSWDDFRDRYGEPDFDVDPESEVAPGG